MKRFKKRRKKRKVVVQSTWEERETNIAIQLFTHSSVTLGCLRREGEKITFVPSKSSLMQNATDTTRVKSKSLSYQQHTITRKRRKTASEESDIEYRGFLTAEQAAASSRTTTER